MTKFRSFLQNALVEYIGVYSDTNNRINKKSVWRSEVFYMRIYIVQVIELFIVISYYSQHCLIWTGNRWNFHVWILFELIFSLNFVSEKCLNAAGCSLYPCLYSSFFCYNPRIIVKSADYETWNFLFWCSPWRLEVKCGLFWFLLIIHGLWE